MAVKNNQRALNKKKKEARLFSCQSKQKHSRVVLREHFDQKNERSSAKIGLVFRDRSDKTSVHQEDGKTYRHRFSGHVTITLGSRRKRETEMLKWRERERKKKTETREKGCL